MRVHQILREAMSIDQAIHQFKQVGVDVAALDADKLKLAYRGLLMKYHPDRNPGDKKAELIAKNLNAAYDVLKSHFSDGYTSSPSGATRKPESARGTTPPWAWAGYSGGIPPDGRINREDYTDMNFIKKSMWELSGHSREQWTIFGFDGHFFRHSVTVFGNTHIFNDMAKAMLVWQAKGGNSYPCRAVFVNKKGQTDESLLIYADGHFYGKEPIIFDHEGNIINDMQFQRRLPDELDRLKDSHNG